MPLRLELELFTLAWPPLGPLLCHCDTLHARMLTPTLSRRFCNLKSTINGQSEEKNICFCTEIQAWFWKGCECEVENEGKPGCCLVSEAERFGMRAHIAEAMTNMDVKDQFG